MWIDWSPVENELRQWRRAGRSPAIWWRDDDTIAPTAALDRLRALAARMGVPAHIAVIPDLVDDSLTEYVRAESSLIPLVHGWRHENNAPQGAKKSEFGHPRPRAKAQITDGLSRLKALFGTDLLPVFVPPWNRIAPEFTPVLAAAGYRGLSTFGERQSALAAEGVYQINTHIDPIFWRGDRGLVDPSTLVDGIVRTLARQRNRGTAEPVGLLTHHLVHTKEVWQFSADCLSVLLDGGAQSFDLRGLI